jgi:hypothetical protein
MPPRMPKEASRQVALGELQGEVPGMPDEPAAGLEEPVLTRQRPALDGRGQDEPAQQIAEVVGDDAEEQPDLVRPEAVTGEARPMGGFFDGTSLPRKVVPSFKSSDERIQAALHEQLIRQQLNTGFPRNVRTQMLESLTVSGWDLADGV